MKFSISVNQNQQLFRFEGEFHEGACVALLGESGAGKTTLLRFLAGFERNRSSQVTIAGGSLTKSWQSSVCLVHQQPTMFLHHTVEKTLKFAQRYRTGAVRLPIESWLDRLELTHLVEHPCVQLSGGQQQRVALLRALISSPTWLLLDESFSALDEKRLLNACSVVQDFLQLTGAGLVLASHNDIPQRFLCDSAFAIRNRIGFAEENLFSALDSNRQSANLTTLFAHAEEHQSSLLMLTLEDQPIYVRAPVQWARGKCRISIASNDVSIAIGDRHQTSMLNRLQAEIIKTDTVNEDSVLVYLKLNQQVLRSLISVLSWTRLKLEVGQMVYAEFKVSAVQWHGQQTSQF